MASPGAPMSVKQSLLDKGAQLMQSLKPIGQMQQHACTFAFHSHDMSRQIEAHHYVARVNQDILQCVVYDSDEPEARLIGMEYIVSDRIFETLDEDEQKLWHSHAYEVKSALWVSPRIPEVLAKLELANFTKTYGKFVEYVTWRNIPHRLVRGREGDVLPLGVPSLMMSAQAVDVAQVDQEKIMRRDDKYNMSIDALKQGRVEMAEPEWINPNADHWKQAGKGFVLEIEPTEMNAFAPFP